jgi:FixJ family two-component response regulator
MIGPAESGRVFIVDDDEAVRRGIGLLMRAVGLQPQTYADAASFLADYRVEWAGCLVSDVRMPRMNGLDLQQELNRRGWSLPVIFLSGFADVPMAVEAMRAGAHDFLQKPFKDDELIRRVQTALSEGNRQREQMRRREQVRGRYASLTPREREVAQRLAGGQANKAIAIDLGLSERTVELHRAHVMQKMDARGVAQLVQMMVTLSEGAAT